MARWLLRDLEHDQLWATMNNGRVTWDMSKDTLFSLMAHT